MGTYKHASTGHIHITNTHTHTYILSTYIHAGIQSRHKERKTNYTRKLRLTKHSQTKTNEKIEKQKYIHKK